MDPKLGLLQTFYAGLPKDRVKLETNEHGFEFLAMLLAEGAVLDYGHLGVHRLLHKYKLSDVPRRAFDRWLARHVAKACNICLYFHAQANDVFCFNLDNNHKENNTVLLPETAVAAATLQDVLSALGCPLLTVASGRGYHLWGRLAAPVANDRIHDLMLRAAARALAALHRDGLDPQKLKFNFYPHPRSVDVVSLRLFGSTHAKTHHFSQILTPAGLLDEPASWQAFEEHLLHRTIPLRTFESALEAIA